VALDGQDVELMLIGDLSHFEHGFYPVGDGLYADAEQRFVGES
jgi:hypothetical protein